MQRILAAVSTIAVLLLVGTGVLSIGFTLQGKAAAKSSASNGIEIADNKVHENTGAVSSQDIRFHEGLCQAGITTEALEGLGGCGILTPPGESENKP
jgi:hypothetical protein